MSDCSKWLGDPYERVHRWIDEYFAVAGAAHRRYRHHVEGVEEARTLFGEGGARAALVHILRDCRNIPKQQDYDSGAVDVLGLKSAWPVSAYIHYTEEAFDALVRYALSGPTGLILWGFFRSSQDVENLLRGIARLTPEEIEGVVAGWTTAVEHYKQISSKPLGPATTRPPDGAVAEYFDAVTQRSPFKQIAEQFGGVTAAMVRVEDLITPLAVIDYEYVEQLKADLQGNEPRDIARFVFPENFQVGVKAAQDPSGRSITMISAEKTLALAPMRVSQIPGIGFEVRMLVTAMPQIVLASQVGGRIFLRNGVHRAFLLASMGLKEIPCVLVQQEEIPVITGIYPTFAPQVLALPRPPLLMDCFNAMVTLTVPIVRTTKIIRIYGEEIVLPTE